MNRRTRPGERQRVARLRRETLRVLGAAELGVVVGAGGGGVVRDEDGEIYKVIKKEQRVGSRYCPPTGND